MDIAELGYKIDSSGLVEGTKALDENAAAADKAGAAAERLEKSQKDASKTASFWANEQAKMNARVQEMERSEERAARAQQQAARASEIRGLNLQKLLGQIAPTVAALNRLAELEDRLGRARDLGALKPQVWAQYQAQIDVTRAKTLELSRTTKGLGGSLGGLSLSTIEAQRNAVSFARALSTGDISGMEAAVTSLGLRAGVLSGALIGVSAAVAGVAAASAGLGYAWLDMDRMLQGLNKQVLLNGDALGIGLPLLKSYTAELNNIKGVSLNDASSALIALAKSGEVAAPQLKGAAEAVLLLAKAGVMDLKEASQIFEDLGRNPVQASERLQKSINFLTATEKLHIEALVEQGRTADAGAYAQDRFAAKVRDTAPKIIDNVDGMTASYRQLKNVVSGLYDAIKLSFDRTPEAVFSNLELSARKTKDAIDSIQAKNPNDSRLPQLLSQLQNYEKKLDDERKRLQAGLTVTLIDGTQPASASELADRADREAWTAQKARHNDRLSWIEEGRRIRALAAKARITDEKEIQRAVDEARRDFDKKIARRDGLNKKNTDDSSALNLLATAQRQVEANKQLAETGIRVTESERLAAKIKQELDDKTNTMTASTRALLKAERERLLTTGADAAAAEQKAKGLIASAELTERLMQLEKQRREQADIDLMGMGHGADATQMLQRQLNIQRQYLAEQEKLDKAYSRERATLSGDALNTRRQQYEEDSAALQSSLNRSLDIERTYQGKRLTLLGDWRAGVTRAWEDYAFAAGNALDQGNGAMTNALSGWEDAWVRFAQTGKLSFSSMIDGMIADLARYAAKQAAVGLLGSLGRSTFGGFLGMGGGVGGVVKETIPLLGFGGGRARGGGVDGSSFYEVGEGGLPELFQQGGKTYLIPGNSGAVIPAAPVAAGGGVGAGPSKVNVTIANAPAGMSGDATVTQGPGGGLNIEVMLKQVKASVADDITNGGSVLSAIKGRLDVQERV